MTPRRLRSSTLVGLVVAAAIVALGWSQDWFALRAEGSSVVVVAGQEAGGALMPLALCILALVFALALAGVVFRVILGVLGAALGACMIVVTATALADPVLVSTESLSAATGLSGSETLHALVTATEVTMWPTVAIVGGALVVLAGLGVAIGAPRWPVSGRKYSRTRAVPAAGADATTGTADPDPIREWDALSEGEDPTAPSR